MPSCVEQLAAILTATAGSGSQINAAILAVATAEWSRILDSANGPDYNPPSCQRSRRLCRLI